MNKEFWAVLGVIIFFVILGWLIGCAKEEIKKQEASASDMTWSYMQSPNSRRCYEVAQSLSTVQGYPALFTMSEIPCALMHMP